MDLMEMWNQMGWMAKAVVIAMSDAGWFCRMATWASTPSTAPTNGTNEVTRAQYIPMPLQACMPAATSRASPASRSASPN